MKRCPARKGPFSRSLEDEERELVNVFNRTRPSVEGQFNRSPKPAMINNGLATQDVYLHTPVGRSEWLSRIAVAAGARWRRQDPGRRGLGRNVWSASSGRDRKAGVDVVVHPPHACNNLTSRGLRPLLQACTDLCPDPRLCHVAGDCVWAHAASRPL